MMTMQVAPQARPSTVFLSLGSNRGDRLATLRTAVARLPAAGVAVERLSAVYETEPVERRRQPWFLNCVLRGRTQLFPLALLAALLELERRMGRRREREPSKGPRTLDLDILLYGDLVIHQGRLQVPHPRLARRRFVLVGLAEVAADLRVPPGGLSVGELLRRVPDRAAVLRRGAL